MEPEYCIRQKSDNTYEVCRIALDGKLESVKTGIDLKRGLGKTIKYADWSKARSILRQTLLPWVTFYSEHVGGRGVEFAELRMIISMDPLDPLAEKAPKEALMKALAERLLP